MSSVVANGTSIAARTDTKHARDVLASAIDQRAPVSIHATGDGFKLECQGLMTGQNDQRLTVELALHGLRFRPLVENARLRIAFEADGTRYVFDVPSPLQWDEKAPNVAHLEKPTLLTVADRRRSQRRRLKQPTTVVLEADHPAGRWTSRGDMLNLSPDGIACRIRAEQAGDLAKGQAVRVSFQLEGEVNPYVWSARVSNATEGGSADWMVVGLEFIPDKCDSVDRERLRRALEGQY